MIITKQNIRVFSNFSFFGLKIGLQSSAYHASIDNNAFTFFCKEIISKHLPIHLEIIRWSWSSWSIRVTSGFGNFLTSHPVYSWGQLGSVQGLRIVTRNEFIRWFHQFVSLILLSLSSSKRKQPIDWSKTVFFCSVCLLKKITMLYPYSIDLFNPLPIFLKV